ncbi:MAG: transcription antitermination factor NusB [Marinilabiliales bacterium]|nr:MAG: transcription antitermination factor NusB [Marinilabiliales bacterium]
MISRRLVRIKAMQTYYAFLQNSGDVSSDQIWKNLKFNIEKSYDLYISLHCLLIAVSDFAVDRMEIAKNKHIPTEKDLNPSTKFVENSIIKAFRDNDTILNYYGKKDYNWSEYPEFIKNIWSRIVNADFYIEYIENPETSLKQDVKIINKIITKILADNPELDDILEEESIFWNDDLEFLLSNIIQNIRKMPENEPAQYELQPIFKNNADEKFAKDLIKKSSLHKDDYDQMILNTLKKWELERVAFTDRVLLHLALCEIEEFPELPVKVTINEYLDIAKFYSTDKSSIFINGILDKVYVKLKTDNKLNKKGLGLVE